MAAQAATTAVYKSCYMWWQSQWMEMTDEIDGTSDVI